MRISYQEKRGVMKVLRIVYVGIWLLCLPFCMQATPLIQKIVNETDFGLFVLSHSDSSSCSLQDKSIVIKPHTTFNNEFLLELGQPSLVLRPVFYQNPSTKDIAWLTDTSFQYQSDLVKQAYQMWRVQKKSHRYKKNDQQWLEHWVGLDMSVLPHQVEMLGYLLNLSRVSIYNNRHQHVQWLSFSKGIFSKLVLELHVLQSDRKGLLGKIVILHGEGGICSNGSIERL